MPRAAFQISLDHIEWFERAPGHLTGLIYVTCAGGSSRAGFHTVHAAAVNVEDGVMLGATPAAEKILNLLEVLEIDIGDEADGQLETVNIHDHEGRWVLLIVPMATP